jgi:hypothetical protein
MDILSVIKSDLTCTRCGEIKETYSEIVYSQGNKVCLDCKEELKVSDKHVFDMDMRLRELPQMH